VRRGRDEKEQRVGTGQRNGVLLLVVKDWCGAEYQASIKERSSEVAEGVGSLVQERLK
jgi:hypothetical protein